MIIVMKQGAPREQVERVEQRIEELGLKPHPIHGTELTVVAVVGDERVTTPETFEVLAGVKKVLSVLAPYKLASAEVHAERSVVKVDGVAFGGKTIPVIAGPCAVESREQILETARAVKEAGGKMLRGGAFKPRTSPYSFQGLEHKGLELLAEAREATGLPVVTEVLTPTDVPLVAEYADMLQIGARNMQNFLLLKAVGKIRKPVFLKRGPAAKLEEFLLAAEYVLSQGNAEVVLCERGIRTFEAHTRNTLSLATIPALHERTHLPAAADPSHGTGRRGLVPAMARATVAAGADALMLEVCPDPATAVSDGAQTLNFKQFAELMKELAPVAAAVGREI